LRQEILYLIGDHVYMCGEGTIGDSIKNAILACGTKLTICTAESITGGLISSLITDTPGSSEYFLGSVISYSSTVKENLLGVDRALIEKKGAVSAGVCTQMAKNARSIFKSDFAVSATGFAGPTVNEEGKFVGLVYTCIAGPDSSIELHEKSFIGTRADIKFRTAQFILNRLRLLIGNIK
jgi:nicotinamide-nucleotide amidase